jgi:uncharacterized protein YprB with RNaseH-like and TPR domain
MIDAREGLVERLRRLNLAAPPRPAEPAARSAQRDLPGGVRTVEGGAVHVAEWTFPRPHLHGRALLDAHAARRAVAAAAASRDPRFRGIDPATWLYLDTETTSLNAGAGVWVFMVGIGWSDGDGFRVQQLLLPDPSGERALLGAVHRRIRAAGALVSFHGKSFDAPRLDDRFRLAGFEPILAGRPHLDLLHPLRRLHGHRLPDCRLRTIEEDLLGLRRVDDLPGALCPDAYFAYLRGRSHRLADVFEHNKLDVLSLSALAGYLAAAYGGECSRSSALRMGLDWADAGELDRARGFLVTAASQSPRAPVSVALSAARLLRRLGQDGEARRLLEDFAARDPEDPRPALALKRFEGRRGRQALSPGVSMQT